MAGSGGTGGPYHFSATGLPAGVTIASNGTISGTPTVSGTFNYTVTVTDKDGHTRHGQLLGDGQSGPCRPLASRSLPFRVSRSLRSRSPGSGGAGGPYTFTATGLPAGLTISANGTISGTPTVSGTFNYTVTVTDKEGHRGTVNCSVFVAAPVTAQPIATGDTATIGFWHNDNGQALNPVVEWRGFFHSTGQLVGGELPQPVWRIQLEQPGREEQRNRRRRVLAVLQDKRDQDECSGDGRGFGRIREQLDSRWRNNGQSLWF